MSIEADKKRYQEILKGKIRENLKKYISNDDMIGKKGDKYVKIPMPQIDLPRFKYANPNDGVGQGPGEGNKPGSEKGDHFLEVEITLEELAQMLGEELKLPRIQPKGKKDNIKSSIIRYTSIRKVGPDGLLHFKRTFKEALKRSLESGVYDEDDPSLILFPEDRRYRSWKEYPNPSNNAVIFFLMDCSGSMSDERKRLARLTNYWIDTWLRYNYKNIRREYIIHDMEAYRVTEEEFYHISHSGGTNISSAYNETIRLINQEYNPLDWNIYVFHSSDGENFDDDNDRAIAALKILLPAINLFGFAQIEANSFMYYASRSFKYVIRQNIEDEKIAIAQIDNNDGILGAIKEFLGKGL